MCATVEAESEDAAREAIRRDWPEAEEWRFCEPRPDKKIELGDRFPLDDWMVERIAKATA